MSITLRAKVKAMVARRFQMLDRLAQRRVARRWRRVARDASVIPVSELRAARGAARELRVYLDRLLHAADERLSLPLLGSNAFPRPADSDWAWRPELWRGPLARPGLSGVETKSKLGEEVTVFHDCARSELTFRQIRNQKEADLAPFGLSIDVLNFDGSFLSGVIDLPKDAVVGMRRSHLLRLNCIVEVEEPIEIFARLNIQHGPNAEQFVRELPLHETDVTVEFDLAYSNLNEKRMDRAWVDLIFDRPAMNRIVIRDLTFSRRPRAAL